MPWSGPRLELAVGCSGLSASRSDWLVEKATELGARSLRPILSERKSSVLGAGSTQRSRQRYFVLTFNCRCRPSIQARARSHAPLMRVLESFSRLFLQHALQPSRRLSQGAAEEGQGSSGAGRGPRTGFEMGTHCAVSHEAVPQASAGSCLWHGTSVVSTDDLHKSCMLLGYWSQAKRGCLVCRR